MSEPPDPLKTVGEIVGGLRALGLEPILVGGMALVVLGSRRVTRDFDLVIAHPGERLGRMLDLFYAHGLELVSHLNSEGAVTATIASRRIAAIRVRFDSPSSVYFFDAETGLRIDLLFDFPIEAAALAKNAIRMKILGHVFAIASEADLLRLKTIARGARSAPGDAEDIAFLLSRISSAP